VTDSLRIVEAPRALTRGESLQLLVVTGPVPQGALIVFRLAPTDTLGVLAPFGPDATSNGGTYTIPIPARFTAPRLTVIVTVESQDGSLRRAPGNDEIRSLQLVILPAG
jgi:hypothetical protein